jgi:hypothetical protein
MSIFRRPDYTSGITDFLTDLKTRQPSLETEQRQGRSIWWDKKLDRSEQQEFREAKVPQKPYVYQTTGHPNSQ